MREDFPKELAGLSRDSDLAALLSLARETGRRVWLCGGTLRDILMGRTPPDLDLAVAGGAWDLGRALAGVRGGIFVPLKAELDSCRVVIQGRELDLTGLRADSIEADLRRRDFSFNALAVDLADLEAASPHILDPSGGLADLRARRLRLAGPGVLADDPLRVLRAFRFISTHGMEPAAHLEEELSAAGPGLFRVAAERIAAEWLKLTAGSRPGAAVTAMERCQCLTRLVPLLALGRGVEQNPYHHLDAFEHSLSAVVHLEAIAADPVAHMGAQGPEAAEYLADSRRRSALFTAALLHDVGKPPTRVEREPGWSTFYRHDRVGARLATQAARRLGLPGEVVKRTARLVGEHMRPFLLMGAQTRNGLTSRAVRRLLDAAGEDLPGMFLLALADTKAGKGPERPDDAEERLLALYGEVAAQRDQWLAAAMAAPPLINGREVMAALGLAPGPEVGRILAVVREAQLEGEVCTNREAMELAKTIAIVGNA